MINKKNIILYIIVISIISVVSLLQVYKYKLLKGYNESYKIYDRNGILLREAVNQNGEKASWVDYKNISSEIIKSIIQFEDKRFYYHIGVDFIAVARASFHNSKEDEIVSGASTITMQLARLLHNHSHRFFGKIAQCLDAFIIELTLGKKQIIAQYLNRAPFGPAIIGIETASKIYFEKTNSHLSLAEATFLAGLPNAPVKLNPYKNFDALKKRQEVILAALLKAKKITDLEYQTALNEKITLSTKEAKYQSMHFTEYILSENPKPGKITTTLDYNLNSNITEIIEDYVFVNSKQGLTNASCIVIDNENGEILGMVGSSGYYKGESGAVNGVLSKRQPGSTLKPFIYALALENGYTQGSVIPDVEIEYTGYDDRLYIPQNFTGTFNGPVLLKDALGRSLNVPAIRLTNSLGIDVFLKKLKEVGFNSLNQNIDHYGLGLVLGNGEVTLMELVNAYSVFANNGIKKKIVSIKSNDKRKDDADEKIYFSKETCFLIKNILMDDNIRIAAFGITNPLLFDFPIAVKTGTSNNWRDNWVIGFTDKFTIGIWVGDFEGAPMNQLSGTSGAGPLFHKIAYMIIKNYYKEFYPQIPSPPDGLIKEVVCSKSGLLPNKYCNEYSTIYINKDIPITEFCNFHISVKIDSRTGGIAKDNCPEKFTQNKEFLYLPSVYHKWQSNMNIPIYSKELDKLNHPAVDRKLEIIKPKHNDVYIIEPGYDTSKQSLELQALIYPPVDSIEWIIDGISLTKAPFPYSASYILRKGNHNVIVSNNGVQSDPVYFEVR
ncbi:MAG: penicillin-binding protein 1C [Spirochaetes bacterium GWF1_31_7]|nr:MAG: penicillin-binding protein 1C [Spirochaetes bacterium GWE1_32_154]OHD51657.1 MAG: penicillin-binding protein 1C [Spirochaetes bacterium GWE2_31_10]OHD51910.1 MAG: penicillin-binding protein 1C [Spirochaetes bacterium GWF1_31_7]OHD76677.1 MAG: penicillin-binding protein 1C [Spirochaetes bacterium RIFOXYB1_FULL_32_8]HBD93786.1 penicillin-binding protein 1C [Spirochaetia bacterium]